MYCKRQHHRMLYYKEEIQAVTLRNAWRDIKNTDTEAGMLPGITRQHNVRSKFYWFSDSAIHNVYHTSLRPSSLLEPRHLSLKVVSNAVAKKLDQEQGVKTKESWKASSSRRQEADPWRSPSLCRPWLTAWGKPPP